MQGRKHLYFRRAVAHECVRHKLLTCAVGHLFSPTIQTEPVSETKPFPWHSVIVAPELPIVMIWTTTP
jgi:hypothetical protein